LSSLADIKSLPSALNSTDLTGAECPLRIEFLAEAVLFHTLIVVSLEAEAIRVLDGLIATSYTGPLCPINLFALELAFNTVASTTPSVELDIIYLIFGENIV